MSVVLALDESLVRVTPTLDDVEPLVLVRTRPGDRADGHLRRIATKLRGRVLPTTEQGGLIETRIPFVHDLAETTFEVNTTSVASCEGAVLHVTDRRARFILRWIDQRYLELRLKLNGPSEIVVNRGLAALMPGGTYNFVGSMRSGEWLETHFDNQAHVGTSFTIHASSDDFVSWKPSEPVRTSKTSKLTPTRFQRVIARRGDE